MEYNTVIGLEIHVQLNTSHKMFAMEKSTYGAPPNTQTSPTTLAHPGTLPSLNQEAVVYAIKMGLACHASITRQNHFDRKSYLYPDLPKGYQITQQRTPICQNGHVTIATSAGAKKVHIERIHLEEDTGKTTHAPNGKTTFIDFNRSGQPLIEIVTKPDMNTPEEAGCFLAAIQRLVRYLDISNGDMEKGAIRCDANISTMLVDSNVLGEKVELKNMNSISHLRLGIAEESRRQIALRAAGNKISCETRSYNPQTGKNEFQRSKGSLSDYRYITDANIAYFIITQDNIDRIRAEMPILPKALARRFETLYSLSRRDIDVLVDHKATGLFFEAMCQHTKHYKTAANWILGPVKYYLNNQKLDWQAFPISPANMARLANIVAEGIISFSTASQKLFPQLLTSPYRDPYQLVKEQALNINDEDQLSDWIDEVLRSYPDKVKAYHAGKTSLLGLFMGKVMSLSTRKADPQKTKQLLLEKLDKYRPKPTA